MTTFRMNANGRGDSFPISGFRDCGQPGYREVRDIERPEYPLGGAQMAERGQRPAQQTRHLYRTARGHTALALVNQIAGLDSNSG